jgi:DNA modification methylase
VELWAIERVRPYARNPRKNDAAVSAVAASIREFGFRQAIVVDAAGMIIVGHTRYKAALELGLRQVPVHVATDLSPEQAKAYRLADNQTGELSTWDYDLLPIELAEVQAADFDLGLLGFDPAELARLMTSPIVAGLCDPDEVPPLPAAATSRFGDQYSLGNHRLLCGDARDTGDVERLMAGAREDLCFTSPPYALGPSIRMRGKTGRARAGNTYGVHDDTIADWPELMRRWFDASQVATGAWVVNLQLLSGNKRPALQWMADGCDRLVDIITWDKTLAAPAFIPGVLSSQFEWLIVLGGKDASRVIPCSSWKGTIANVHRAPPQRNNEYSDIHGATMPIHLATWSLQTLCDLAKSVYDPFGGTGTTLIAAEQLGRRAYLMEIDPLYCDVIVQRWEKFTGRKAELVHRGSGCASAAAKP